MRVLVILVAAALVLPQIALAVITFTQLDEDTFVISHRVKIIGSRGKAQKLVYVKASSLCEAAGYAYFKIQDQESGAAQHYESANASIRVQLFQSDAEDRIGCERNADPKYVQQARAKLAKIGYQPPSETPAPQPAEDQGATKTCTIEQISAMVKAGFSDEQIKAACPN
jgi:hypothetical protein